MVEGEKEGKRGVPGPGADLEGVWGVRVMPPSPRVSAAFGTALHASDRSQAGKAVLQKPGHNRSSGSLWIPGAGKNPLRRGNTEPLQLSAPTARQHRASPELLQMRWRSTPFPFHSKVFYVVPKLIATCLIFPWAKVDFEFLFCSLYTIASPSMLNKPWKSCPSPKKNLG